MKKKVFVALTFVAFLSLVFIACKKDDDGLQVGYSNDNGTGANPDNTSAGSTSSGGTGGFSTAGATTSSTGGSTTSTPTGNYFKVNGTVYNCSSVTGGNWNNTWSIIGRSAAGDTCSVSFNAIPAAGTYPETTSPFSMGAHECLVAVETGNSAYVYLASSGNAVITAPTASTRKVSITNMQMAEISSGAVITLNASMTTP